MKKDEVDKVLSRKKPKVMTKGGLSTGSTLINLASSGKPNVGLMPGHYYNFTGDSESGKTFLALTCMAEAGVNSDYRKHRFIYNAPEDGALMDIQHFFGSAVAYRLERERSRTVEDFYFHVSDCLKDKRPFIYALDSMDALSSEDDEDKFEERKKAANKGKETTGSYGTSKAKRNSSDLRVITNNLASTSSILIIIGQTRQNIGFGSQFNPKVRSGGTSLRFYATSEFWTSIKSKHTKKVRGKDRDTGITMRVQVKKNRMTGRHRSVDVPIMYDRGVDDIGSCVDFLVEEKHWDAAGKTDAAKTIIAKDFDFIGKREDLIQHILEKKLGKDLRALATEVWNEIEKECEVIREERYA